VSQASFPISYSLSNCFLIMNHVVWTVIMWDALHNYAHKLQSKWWISVTFVVTVHILNSLIVSLILKMHRSIYLVYEYKGEWRLNYSRSSFSSFGLCLLRLYCGQKTGNISMVFQSCWHQHADSNELSFKYHLISSLYYLL
jgi:hypothetical protein